VKGTIGGHKAAIAFLARKKGRKKGGSPCNPPLCQLFTEKRKKEKRNKLGKERKRVSKRRASALSSHQRGKRKKEKKGGIDGMKSN